MNKVWCLALLLAFGSNADCLKLVNLCEKDHFKYNGVQVNSVYLSEHEIQLKTAEHFLIEPYEGCSGWNNYFDGDPKEFYKLKEDYNKAVVQIYSEHYLNPLNKTKIMEEKKRIAAWLKQLEKWEERGRAKQGGKYYADCLKRQFDEFVAKVQATVYLIDGLLPLFDQRANHYKKAYVPSKLQLFEELRTAISEISAGIETGQTTGIHDRSIDEIYEMRIASLPQIEFQRKSRVTYDQDSYLAMRYQLVFPFNSDSFDSSAKCLSASDLPPFFTEKH